MEALLATLDHQFNLDLVIWAFPLAFLIHDLEEILTMERFRREKRERFPAFMRNAIAITTRQFILAVAFLFVLILLASYLATRSPRQIDLLTTALAIFLVHVFGHVALPLFMRTYTPGVITAILVVLPYSLYGFHRLFAARLIDDTNFTTTLLIGALLFVPLVVAANLLGKLLIRR